MPIHNFGGATLIDMDPVYDLVCDDCLDDHGIRLRVEVGKDVFRRESNSASQNIDPDSRGLIISYSGLVEQNCWYRLRAHHQW